MYIYICIIILLLHGLLDALLNGLLNGLPVMDGQGGYSPGSCCAVSKVTPSGLKLDGAASLPGGDRGGNPLTILVRPFNKPFNKAFNRPFNRNIIIHIHIYI